MKKIVTFLATCMLLGCTQLFPCDKCVTQNNTTVKACDDLIKECEVCLKATHKLANECDNCKSTCKTLIKRGSAAINYCNRCKAGCSTYISIQRSLVDARVAQGECISFCQKCIKYNQKLIKFCKENLQEFQKCKNQNISRKGIAHKLLVNACTRCSEEGGVCNRTCEKCIEKLKACKKK